MQFHGKIFFDLFDFTSFLAWTFFNFLAHCVAVCLHYVLNNNNNFFRQISVMEFLLKLMKQEKLMDRVTRLLLLWVHNHFLDFETFSY